MSRRHADGLGVTVRLPYDLVSRLDAIARRRVVGRSLLVRIAIEELVERLEGDDPVPARPDTRA